MIAFRGLTAAMSRLSADIPIRRAAAELLFVRRLRVATSCLNPAQACVLAADDTVVRRAGALGTTLLSDTATDLNSVLHVPVDQLQHNPGPP